MQHNVFPQGMSPYRPEGMPCVFISHRNKDKDLARSVANYFENIRLYYWFDEKDLMIEQAIAAGHSKERALVEGIDMGVKHCTHLLGIISPNTVGSWWVPYEIGSGRAAGLDTAFIVIEGVQDVPEYIKISHLLWSREQMSDWSISLAAIPSSTKLLEEIRERFDNPVESELFGAGWAEEYDERLGNLRYSLSNKGRASLARINAWKD